MTLKRRLLFTGIWMTLVYFVEGLVFYHHPGGPRELNININDVPTRVPMETEALSLHRNNITEIPIRVFSHLRRCKSLDLSSNNIIELRKGMFKGLGSLRWLSLKRNRIRHIGPRSFVHLRKCQQLILVKNRLTEIQPTMWEGLVSLWFLDLTNNKIRALQLEAFRATETESKMGGLTNELTLYLSKNRLANIEPGTFSGLRLRTLVVSPRRLPVGVWNGVLSMYSLRFPYGRLKKLQHFTFNGVETLNDISLEGNRISQIEDGTFSKFNVCKDLWLGKNDLSDIKGGMWIGLVSLERFSLESNKLTEIRQDMWWKGMKHLKSLWLEDNNITQIEDGAFRRLRGLQDIRLFGNRLTALRPGMWRGLPQLQTIYLFSNRISVIEPGTFAHLTKISSIRLDYNNVSRSTISHAFWGGDPRQVVHVRVNGNPIPCDSALCWAKKLDYHTKEKVLVRLCWNKNQTFCNDERECLNRCDAHLIEREENEADDNSDDDTVPDRDSDIDTGVRILNDDLDDNNTTALEGNNEQTIQDDDDEAETIQIHENDTNVSEGILANSSGTFLVLPLSLDVSLNSGNNKTSVSNVSQAAGDAIINKTSVSNVSQSAGSDGIINKIWKMVKAVLSEAKKFWFRITGEAE